MLEIKLLQQQKRKQKYVKAIQLPEIYQNKITIQETLKYPESCLSEPVNNNITPDVSITMDSVNTAENENEFCLILTSIWIENIGFLSKTKYT